MEYMVRSKSGNMRYWIVLILWGLFSLNSIALCAKEVERATDVPLSAAMLSAYIQIPSITGNERLAGVHLKALFEQAGLYVHVFSEEQDAYNISASLYPLSAGKPNVILLSHMDVVAANDTHLYTHPPFSGVIADGKVWGRGAIDNKGMTIMQLLATLTFLEEAKRKNLPYNVTLLVVSGEETGGEKGSKYMVDHHYETLNPVVVFGEGGSGLEGVINRKPSQRIFGIAIASKRPLWLELSLNTACSGHSSIPPNNYPLQQKVVALEKIIAYNQNRRLQFSTATKRMFADIGKIEGGLRGFMLQNLSTLSPIAKGYLRKNEIVYSVLSNTVTITSIHTTHGAINVIPNETKATLDCRLLPGVTTDAFIAELHKQLNNENISIKILKEGVAAEATVPDHFFDFTKRALEEVYPEGKVISMLFPASDDNNYFRAKGVPVYGIMPTFLSRAQLESIHSIDEHIPMDCLENGIKVYRKILQSIMNYGVANPLRMYTKQNPAFK